MSINLVKGDKISLSKERPHLSNLQVGLGWITHADLDTIAFLTDKNGKIKKTVYFGNKNEPGIYLNGDDLTGGKKGDCEIIFVDFHNLPEWVTRIQFCVNIFCFLGIHVFSPRDFKSVKNSYVRLVDTQTGDELCRYDLKEDGKGYDAFHFADLYKDEYGNWQFETVGVGMRGQIETLKSLLSK